ncbi:DUF5776 domain-containing protein [Lentilactobacillus parabuchneri]
MKHNLTTRYQLTNGYYITGNKGCSSNQVDGGSS